MATAERGLEPPKPPKKAKSKQRQWRDPFDDDFAFAGGKKLVNEELPDPPPDPRTQGMIVESSNVGELNALDPGILADLLPPGDRGDGIIFDGVVQRMKNVRATSRTSRP